MEWDKYLNKRFSKSDLLVARKIDDELIIIPICRKADEVESIYTLNEVAAFIWELVDGNRSGEQIRDKMLNEFEVSVEEAEKDLGELLQQLLGIGALTET